MYQRKLISVGNCPLSYLLNLPPALCLDEFQFWDSHRCFSGEFEPHCRRGQAIMQRAKHLAFITPISFFFRQVKMRCSLRWCADMLPLMAVKMMMMMAVLLWFFLMIAIMLTSWLSLTLKEVGILHHGYDAVMVMHYILKQKKIKSTSFPTVLFILRYVQVLVSLSGGKHQVKGRS